MKKVPKFLKGPFRNALKFAMEKAITRDEVRQSRGWKLFMMLPRLLPHRPPGGGLISKSKCGNWTELIRASAECDDLAASRRRHARRQRFNDDLKQRVAKTSKIERSIARRAVESCARGQFPVG